MEEIRDLAREQVEKRKLMTRRHGGNRVMSGDDSQQIARTADERSGLHGTHPGFQKDLKRRSAGEGLAMGDIGDDDALARFHGHFANGGLFRYHVKKS